MTEPMVIYTVEQLEGLGFISLDKMLVGEPFPYLSDVTKLCKELDVTYDSVRLFHVGNGDWCAFYHKDKPMTKGFKEEKILP